MLSPLHHACSLKIFLWSGNGSSFIFNDDDYDVDDDSDDEDDDEVKFLSKYRFLVFFFFYHHSTLQSGNGLNLLLCAINGVAKMEDKRRVFWTSREFSEQV